MVASSILPVTIHKGKLYFLHRIKPDIQIVVGIEKLEELTDDFWQKYFLNFDKNIVLAPKFDHEVSYIGGGGVHPSKHPKDG